MTTDGADPGPSARPREDLTVSISTFTASTRRRAAVPLLAAALLAPLGVTTAGATDAPTAADYGIPHIRAGTHTGLGFGLGRAQGGDALCVLADAYLTVDAERSRHLGRSVTPTRRSTSSSRCSGPTAGTACPPDLGSAAAEPR